MALIDVDAFDGKIWNGGWVVAETGAVHSVVEPATGNELARVGEAAPSDITAAANAAAAAQKDWAVTGYEERAKILRTAGDLLLANMDEICGWIIREAGSIPGKAAFEVAVAANECYEAATLPSRPYGELLASAQPRLSFARRLPAGVVGVIAPFNVPLILSIRSVAPALALGNAVLLKPDLRTAVSGGVVLARIFEQAGLPAGVLHVLAGGAKVGEAVVTDPNIRIISFTGSTAVGRIVGELAGKHLKRAHLELGGNSALVILEDADLEAAVSCASWGSFFHQGQICMTTGRHLVHERLLDDYVSLLAHHADRLSVGNPATEEVALGPIIDAKQRDRIHSLVTASVDAGARVAAGGRYENLFYRPTVITDITTSMPAYAEEVFGPVAPVMGFSTLEEAASLASASEYGLSLGIVTKDPLRALELAARIPTGAIHINDQTVNDEAQIPFGGVGASGTGARFGGAQANVEAFTETQWVTMRSEAAQYPF